MHVVLMDIKDVNSVACAIVEWHKINNCNNDDNVICMSV